MSFQRTVLAITDDLHVHGRFTAIPFKPFSDQKSGRYRRLILIISPLFYSRN